MPMGIYSAAAGMAAQQQQLDNIANDLSNVNTNGYKKVRSDFRDLVYTNGIGSGSALVDGGRDFTAGATHQVDDPLSLALGGPGFFQVKLADGRVALTRDGSFRVDANGQIVTSTGQKLEPPIKLPKGTEPGDVTIAADGKVTTKGTALGQIKVVDVPARTGLQPIGDSLFVATQASGAARATTGSPNIQQGYVEASNVDVGASMTDMIETQRSFQLTSRVISMQDQLMQIANDIRR
jgi:flagellar basal-body rod protein FlgG